MLIWYFKSRSFSNEIGKLKSFISFGRGTFWPITLRVKVIAGL
ncbi:hypothetical protein LINGRAHAP2_LOCUS7749 [Linum grandiflorum]